MTASLSRSLTQFFPPKPSYTDADIPNLHGKVYIVTGANSGIGKEVASILYAKNATVYLAARSKDKAEIAIQDIKTSSPTSKGSLVFLSFDLEDLAKVKQAAEEFLKKEKELHVLFNNAGVMSSDPMTRTVQGHEQALGVNCIGTLLFTLLLAPTLAATAAKAPKNTVRVVWLSSFGLQLYAAKDVGVDLTNLDYHTPVIGIDRYGISKCGAWALGVEFARRYRKNGIISMPMNPGNVTSELTRDQPIKLKIIARVVSYPTVLGASAELWAGMSGDVGIEDSGRWVIPFGRFGDLRPDLHNATKPEAEGGTDGCAKFWDWCENEIRGYL